MNGRQDAILVNRFYEIRNIEHNPKLRKERLENFLKDLEQIEYLGTTGIRIKKIVETEIEFIS